MISHATLHLAFVSLFATLAAVSLQPAEAADFVELKREKYQKEIDGKKVDLYTIRNRGGMVVKITNWGAKVQQILVPGRNGVLDDVALGYETIDDLQAGQASMGAFVGRYANRIGQAKFTLNGQEYRLAANSGPNSLHGGLKGSRFVVFDARRIDDAIMKSRNSQTSASRTAAPGLVWPSAKQTRAPRISSTKNTRFEM